MSAGVGGLVSRWRARAAELEPYAPVAAHAFNTAAHELEQELRKEEDDELTLTEASAVSGYSVDHLARLIRQGRIRNVGRPHAPRVRRGDLPRKAGVLPTRATGPHVLGADPRQVARAVATREDSR